MTFGATTTYDPDTGIDNTAIQRCWVQEPRRMTYFPYPASHNARNVRKFHARGEPAPVAFWIGHHPAVLLGTQAKLRYPESHWSAAGGVIEHLTEDDWEKGLQLKFMGYVRCLRYALPLMVKQGGGRVVNLIGNDGVKPSYWEICPGAANAAGADARFQNV